MPLAMDPKSTKVSEEDGMHDLAYMHCIAYMKDANMH
jgi:hypothetical protein